MPGAVHSAVVVHYMKRVGISGDNMGPHALRATAATSALEHGRRANSHCIHRRIMKRCLRLVGLTVCIVSAL